MEKVAKSKVLYEINLMLKSCVDPVINSVITGKPSYEESQFPHMNLA